MSSSVSAPAQPFPTPVFEGSEKRIEIDFAHAHGANTAPDGLRSVTRESLDAVLDLAACCIVSARHGTEFDAYVLSESSLFVYPRKAILKTCGTTKLLAAVPALIDAAAAVGLTPCRAKYSRASFLFPEQQPKMHASFADETELLQMAFATMGGISSAYVLGDILAGLQWHVFVAHGAEAADWHKPAYTLEVCMTGLATNKAAQFVRGDNFKSSQAVTESSGIRALLPASRIDDYVFEPCGYSMNGVDGLQCSTIHITPEDGFSYASFEVSCTALHDVETARLVRQVAEIFEPAEMAVVMTVDGEHGACPQWGTEVTAPAGYSISSDTRQRFRAGGRVTYVTLSSDAAAAAALAPSSGSVMSLDSADAHMCPPQTESNLSDNESELSDATRRTSSEAPCPPVPAARESSLPYEYSSDSDAAESSDGPDTHTPEKDVPITKQAEKDIEEVDVAGAAASAPAGDLPPAAAAVMAAYGAVLVKAVDDAALDAHIATLIATEQLEDTFYVMDLGMVAALAAGWAALMPRVRPFYAVKCNGDTALLSTLAACGASFDCASEAEIAAVAALGVSPERIVFANACKRPSDIRAAKKAGVALTTADSLSELRKIAQGFPTAEVLLRIRQDDPSARCQLGNKYGAEAADIPGLLEEAKVLGLDLAGVSFHVGSGASNPQALPAGIAAAAAVFRSAAALGFNMRVLDVGGGFPGGRIDTKGRLDLGAVPAAVNAALDAHFPPSCGVDIIAEPGRFFAEACAVLACQVFGSRERSADAAKATPEGTLVDYYITDGLYGSFNCILYDHAQPTARPLRGATIDATAAAAAARDGGSGGSWLLVDGAGGVASEAAPAGNECSGAGDGAGDLVASTVFGPSCDGLDTVFNNVPLPRLDNGDWLLFPAMGAYTLCGASNFNGIPAADVRTFYVQSDLRS